MKSIIKVLKKFRFLCRYKIMRGGKWQSPFHKVAFELHTCPSSSTIHLILDLGLLKHAKELSLSHPSLITPTLHARILLMDGNAKDAARILSCIFDYKLSSKDQRYAAKMLTRLNPNQSAAEAFRRGQLLKANCITYAADLSYRRTPIAIDEHSDSIFLNINESKTKSEKITLLNRYWNRHGYSSIEIGDNTLEFDITALTGKARRLHPKVKKIDVSVIITAYNAGEYLKSAVTSIISQTNVTPEIIIIDDASMDNTWETIGDLVAEYPEYIKAERLLENAGTYTAKNRGLSLSSAEHIAFQDADDWSHPDRLISALNLLRSNSGLVAVTSKYLRLTTDGRFWSPNTWPLRQWSPNTLVFKRNVLNRLKSFDSVRFGADTDFYERLRFHFGDKRLYIQDAVLLIAMALPKSLMHHTAAAESKNGYSQKRVSYRDNRNSCLLKSLALELE